MSDQTSEVDLAAVRAAIGRLGRPLFAWLLIVIGVVVLVVAWIGVSGQALVAKQLPYVISGGLGGFSMIIVGAALVAGQDLRSVGDRVERLERKVDDLHAVLLAGDLDTASVPVNGQGHAAHDGGTPGQVVAVPDGERFHAPDCPIVVNRDGTERLEPTEAEERGLVPCKVCEPTAAPSAR